MPTVESVTDLISLYEDRGGADYGEALSQTQHALQCAALARAANAGDALIVAALLHDVGHLLDHAPSWSPDNPDIADDIHHATGARILSPLFGPAVALPVSLHVTAKRWRCARDPMYLQQLSPASVASLRAQGGPLSEIACQRFERHPGFDDAVQLRDWDDRAKVVGRNVGELREYLPLLTSLATPWSRECHER